MKNFALKDFKRYFAFFLLDPHGGETFTGWCIIGCSIYGVYSFFQPFPIHHLYLAIFTVVSESLTVVVGAGGAVILFIIALSWIITKVSNMDDYIHNLLISWRDAE